jgi:hypothetical protein
VPGLPGKNVQVLRHGEFKFSSYIKSRTGLAVWHSRLSGRSSEKHCPLGCDTDQCSKYLETFRKNLVTPPGRLNIGLLRNDGQFLTDCVVWHIGTQHSSAGLCLRKFLARNWNIDPPILMFVTVLYTKYINTVEPGYNDIGLCETLSITSDILWCQLIPHC